MPVSPEPSVRLVIVPPRPTAVLLCASWAPPGGIAANGFGIGARLPKPSQYTLVVDAAALATQDPSAIATRTATALLSATPSRLAPRARGRARAGRGAAATHDATDMADLRTGRI